MKKFLLTLSTVAVAGLASAASVGWTLAGATAYAGGAYKFFVIGQNGVTSVDAITALLDAGKDVSSYQFGSGTIGSNGAANKPATTAPIVSLDAGNTYEGFYVLFDSATVKAGETKYLAITSAQGAKLIQSPAASAGTITFAAASQANYINSADNWASFGPAATPVDPDPIPEPTTAALLALGLAAFGLKRKVA